MRTIFLTGFMGSGKTTIGTMLGEKLRIPAYDMDQLIVQKAGKSINEVFDDDGESFFRKLESDVLKSLPLENALVMTGGGIILDEGNRKWMKENGLTVYLKCSIDQIKKRLENDETRPLINGSKKKDIEKIFLSRKELYEEAELTVDVTALEPPVIVDLLIERLKSINNTHNIMGGYNENE